MNDSEIVLAIAALFRSEHALIFWEIRQDLGVLLIHQGHHGGVVGGALDKGVPRDQEGHTVVLAEEEVNATVCDRIARVVSGNDPVIKADG